MRQKITYIASDGKEFDDKNAAIEYENLFKKWEQNKNNAIKLGSGVSVSCDDIIEYFKNLVAINVHSLEIVIKWKIELDDQQRIRSRYVM